MLQSEALNLLKMGHNVFLTGEAGSGKTYLLNEYIRYLRECKIRVAVSASTGIAATHLNGGTIHSWSGIGVKDTLTSSDLEKILSNDRIKRNYKKTRVLIIDEISMLHKHQLDMVDTIARHMLDPDKSFGGLQVILCGDFFQLPPVSTENTLSQDKQFAFESNAWQNGDFYVCYLLEQHRQGDDPLYQVLNDIRSGTAGEHTKIPLRTRYKKEPIGATKPTKLYSRNMNVDVINNGELSLLSTKEKIFKMQTIGFSELVNSLKKNCLAPEELKLKIGAQVMFIKNDASGNYLNGTRAIVTGFEKSPDGLPIVKTYDQRMLVVKPEDWKYEDNDVVRATITQIPLRLAWAITIHKSQGMTLDAAEIDLGDAFEPGMGYVALSRVRRLDGLKLMNLNEMALKVHPKILTHDKIFKQCSFDNVAYLQEFTSDDIVKFHTQTLIDRFGGSVEKSKKQSTKKTKTKKEKSIPTHFITMEMFKKNQTIETIAAERGITIGTVMHHLERVKSLQLISNSELSCLRTTIRQEEFDEIFSALSASEDGKLAPIYNQFDGKYSYENIRLVRLFIL